MLMQQQQKNTTAVMPNKMFLIWSTLPALLIAAGELGDAVGSITVGNADGAAVDGRGVGTRVGLGDGAADGGRVGIGDGRALGIEVGADVGGVLGVGVGCSVGSGDGAGVGENVSTSTESTVVLAIVPVRRRPADAVPPPAQRCIDSVKDPSLTAVDKTPVTWLCIEASASPG